MDLTQALAKTTALQSSLYKAAVANAERRFYALYDKLYREDVLMVAWKQVRENRGSPGADGITISSIAQGDVSAYLADLALELKEDRYRPTPVRRVVIPKDGGKVRNLGVPTVRDRIVQAAAKLILEPIFEADFSDTSYGFRPGIGQHEALANVHKNAEAGYRVVLDADIAGFFDEVNHEHLMAALRRRVSDGRVLRLIWRWLKAGVFVFAHREDTDKGTPQGGVLSPLLANVYLHEMDKSFSSARPRMGLMTRYADDFVIQCGTAVHAERALQWVRAHLERIGLQLHAEKTRIVVDTEGFDFLGFHHRRVYGGWGKCYRWPSSKACQRFRDRFRALMHKGGNVQTADGWAELVGRLTRYLGGWRHYYCHGQSWNVFQKLDWFALECLARHKARCQPRGKKRRKLKWQAYAGLFARERILPRLQRSKDWPSSNYRGGANVRWRAV